MGFRALDDSLSLGYIGLQGLGFRASGLWSSKGLSSQGFIEVRWDCKVTESSGIQGFKGFGVQDARCKGLTWFNQPCTDACSLIPRPYALGTKP